MSARPLGEIIEGILARTEAMLGFQELLRKCPTNSDRKQMIMEAHARGAIGDDDAELLIQAHMLETD